MANAKVLTKMRDIMIALTAALMILVVVFQVLEVQKFELMTVIKTRIGAIFGSGSAPAAPAVPAGTAAPAVPAAPAGAANEAAKDGAAGPAGVKNAVNAKRTAEADAGL